MQKVAHYRRAIWLAGGRDIERMMRRALARAPDVETTKFEYVAGVTAQIAERSEVGRGLGLYFTLFAEGGRAATVENGGSTVGRTNPPRGREFLKTGIHIVIQGDHLSYVSMGQTNDGQITQLIAKFLENHGVPRDQLQFSFMARSNRRELDRLLRQGVKSIDLGVTSFMATAEQLAGGHRRDGLAQRGEAFVDAFRAMFGHDRRPEEIEAASEIHASLHIDYDGRSASPLVPELLSGLAHRVAGGDEEFKIVTKQDVVITRDRLVIKRDVIVDGDSEALESASAFGALRNCLAEWRATGILDE
jgi:hypothetical protein